jgi:hypothetical protein
MPFSLNFSNLWKIIVVRDLQYLIQMAQLGDRPGWVEFVKLRERDQVEVVHMATLLYSSQRVGTEGMNFSVRVVKTLAEGW